MGGEVDVLWVDVRAQTNEQSFRQMEQQVGAAGDRAGKAGGAGLSGAMGTALSALPALAATAAAAVGAALVGGIKSAVDVAQQARQGVVELQASLGVTGEEAQRLGEVTKQDLSFYDVIKSVLIAGLHHHATNLCVEVGRQAAPEHLRPSFVDVETALRDMKKAA